MIPYATSIHGSIVALITPMFEDGSIDWDGLKQLVEWHIQQGTHSIVAVGTTGEASTLNLDEHTRVIAEVVKTANKRIPIIAGTGANSTVEAIELTQAAKNVCADAALLVTPYYNKPTQEGMYQHYKAIAEAVDIPQILYNVPSRTGVDLHNATAVRLSEMSNIVAIKDATGDLSRGGELINALDPQKMVVFSGDDPSAWQLILAGARGNISVTANAAPYAMSQICTAALAQDASRAERLNAELAKLHEILFCESNPIPVKWALHEMAKTTTGIRLPLTPLAEQFRAPVREALQATGLI